ncbi:hypothetical protein ACFQWH_00845 [Mycolicibacterium sp. GCM10028919]|uniref:hypothetical protein n=1 Tax=Mycolicibacterium sp. GCM10028919 TaxID=3273401 RepID=UPI00361A0DA3
MSADNHRPPFRRRRHARGSTSARRGQSGIVKWRPFDLQAVWSAGHVTHNTGTYPSSVLGFLRALPEYVVLWPRLLLTNRRSTRSIVGDGNGDGEANVSLTTYGKRTATVWKTIETIGSGTVRPRRLILWLDDAATVANPPATLQRLVSRGLEIRLCHDYGPHKKYFPYVQEIFPEEPSVTLVTVDDDAYYPPTWLEELLDAHRPNEVTAFRARIRGAGPYGSWPTCESREPSPRVFATGVSGVAYPPPLLRTLRERGDEFIEVCPRADDFWLHYAAVATGVPIRQVRETAALWWEMPIASNCGLWDRKGTANDAIAAKAESAWLGLHSSDDAASPQNRARAG